MITGYCIKTESTITKTLKKEDFDREMLRHIQDDTRFKAKVYEFEDRKQMLRWLRKPFKFLKKLPKQTEDEEAVQ